METVVIVIHLMVIVAMIAMVLLQRSEGGALGIGGGPGGMMSARGQGNVLTRSTGVLAAAFFATSIVLTILARLNEPASAILDSVPITSAPVEDGSGGQGLLESLEGLSQPSDEAPMVTDDGTTFNTPPSGPQIPTSQ